jgi:hypothetical protein
MVSRKNLKIDFRHGPRQNRAPWAQKRRHTLVAELVGCRIGEQLNPSMLFRVANAVVTGPGVRDLSRFLEKACLAFHSNISPFSQTGRASTSAVRHIDSAKQESRASTAARTAKSATGSYPAA